MAVTEVCQLLVDLDQAVQKRKGQTEQRLVAVEHDEKSRAQGLRREIARAVLEKSIVELPQKIGPFVALRQAGFVQFSITLPKPGSDGVSRVCFFAIPILP